MKRTFAMLLCCVMMLTLLPSASFAVSTEGYSDKKFGMDLVNLEQMAAILYRYAGIKGYDVTVDENTNSLDFNDFADISDYAGPAAMRAIDKGLIEGKDYYLYPKSCVSREQVAAILHRFCAKIVK